MKTKTSARAPHTKSVPVVVPAAERTPWRYVLHCPHCLTHFDAVGPTYHVLSGRTCPECHAADWQLDSAVPIRPTPHATEIAA
jgi:hypothetical protein